MSILIKGMEMPKNCLECSFKFVDIKYGDGCCLFTGIVCLSIGRQDRCPLIEIPTPHGRLIDADELKAECYHTMDELMKSTTMNISAEALSLLCGFTMIGEASTILEEER